MSIMPKVTVAMSSYNHEKYVGATIESVLSQSRCDYEFSIVDDGSSDNTVKEIQRFKDSRILFTPLVKNKGACVALRKAIENGTGEYVSIINSDDCFLPGKLKRQADFLDSNPDVQAVFAYPEFVDDKGNLLNQTGHFCGSVFFQPNRSRYEWLKFFFLNSNALCHPTVMIRRQCYETLGYYDPRLRQLPDFEFWIRLLFKYNIHILPEKLIQFRILPQGGNTSAPSDAAMNQTFWETLHCLRNFLKISTIDEYLTIFPEEASQVLHRDDDLVPFYLANMTLRQQGILASVYQLFALETLSSLFDCPIICKKLENIGYTYNDFFISARANRIFYNSPFNSSTTFERLVKYTSPIWISKKMITTFLKLFK